MKSLIQLFLAVQFAMFVFAASAHFGLFGDRDDPGAAVAESVIAVVLLAGLALTFTGGGVRPIALVVQGFALLGTLVGVTLVLTVGPTKTFDLVVHGVMLGLLAGGLIVTYRATRDHDMALIVHERLRCASQPGHATVGAILRETIRRDVRRSHPWT